MEKMFDAIKPKISPNSDVSLIALWFLGKSNMSHKKLQKLCYYAQVWSLLELGESIVPGIRFEAWVHGPVCPELYQILKKFGWRDIMIAKDVEKSIEKQFDEFLTDDQKKILEFAYDIYGDMSADDLEGLSHQEEPWKAARGGRGIFEPCNTEITNESIRDYYLKKYEEYI
jgi:hypothetical protein